MENVLCYNCMSIIPGNASFCSECGVRRKDIIPAPHHLVPGSVLMNRYTVGRALGEGMFGITYIGYDNKTGSKTVIKEYYPRGSASRDITSPDVKCKEADRALFQKGLNEFLRQAAAVSAMGPTDAFVRLTGSFTEHGTAYMVLDHADGETLKKYTEERGGKLPAAEVLKILEPVFPALGKYHGTGFTHRDISADNIIIKNGRVCLIDFGISGELPDGSSAASTVTVKNSYAPLEQLQSKGQGVWTDVYLLASVIYSCIMGIPPARPLDRIMGIDLKLPSQSGIAIDPGQQNALIKALAIKPDDRFRSLTEFYAELYPAGKAFCAPDNGITSHPLTVSLDTPLNVRFDPVQDPQPRPVPMPQMQSAPMTQPRPAPIPQPRTAPIPQKQEQTGSAKTKNNDVTEPEKDTHKKSSAHKRKHVGVLVAVCIICAALIAAAAVYVFVIRGKTGDTDNDVPDETTLTTTSASGAVSEEPASAAEPAAVTTSAAEGTTAAEGTAASAAETLPAAPSDPRVITEQVMGGKNISFASEDDDVTFFVTTDGTDPTTASMECHPGEYIILNDTTVIKVIAYRSGASSGITEKRIVVSRTKDVDFKTESSGSKTKVTLSTETTGAEIYYTTDGTDPLFGSGRQKYTGPFNVSGGTTITAYATSMGHSNSTPKTLYIREAYNDHDSGSDTGSNSGSNYDDNDSGYDRDDGYYDDYDDDSGYDQDDDNDDDYYDDYDDDYDDGGDYENDDDYDDDYEDEVSPINIDGWDDEDEAEDEIVAD